MSGKPNDEGAAVHNNHDTQPLDENWSESSTCSSASSVSAPPPYAKLEPLMRFLSRIELRSNTFVCGRGISVRVNYDFPELRDFNQSVYNLLSKQHFRLDRVHGQTVLTDLSLNGTFVDKKLIGKGSKCVLKSGAVITCARKDLRMFVYVEDTQEGYPPQLTNKYIMINTSLGKGGYGKVVLGKLWKDCETEVAVKILDTTRLSRRFSRAICKAEDVEKEVAIMLQIKHPNCVEFIDWIETEHTAYIVMEVVGGGELYDRIVDKKWNGMGFGEGLCKFYGWQLLSAVEYLHERGITHRDIKPENILCMTKEDYTVVKLADFGLAKGSEGSTMKTLCGTPAYMAPELIDSVHAAYNPKVDMWSLGVVLFVGVCGYPPFSEDYTDMSMNSQIRKGRLKFLNSWKFVSLETQFTIKSMLKVDPALRLSASEALKKSWLRDSPEVAKAKLQVQLYIQGKKILDSPTMVCGQAESR